MKKKLIMTMVTILLFFGSLGGPVLAQEADSAGNIFSSKNIVDTIAGQNDYYWSGQSLDLSASKVANDILAAGYRISLDSVTVGGSLRAAANTIEVIEANVAKNITVAGYSVNINEGTTAQGIYAAGNEVLMAGQCSNLTAFAETVYLDGTVNGDANINANRVVIGDHAVVTGTLTVKASEEPAVPAGAAIGKVDFQKDEATSVDNADSAGEAANAAGASVLAKFKHVGYWLVVNVAIAALLILLGNKVIEKAKVMTVTKTANLILSGVVATVALPMLVFVIALTFIGLPIAAIVTMVAVVVGMVGTAFAGSALARLVLPQWNIWGSSLLGAAVLSLVGTLPFIGFMVSIAAFVYTMGYLVQAVWQQMRRPKTTDVQVEE